MNDFYVYAHMTDDLIIRYIGKGRRGRAYVVNPSSRRGHHRSWLVSLATQGKRPVIEILEKGLTEQQALQSEMNWIALLRPLGNLTNLTDGGEGTSGWKASPATRAKMSAARKGRKVSDATKAKMSASLMGHAVSEKALAAFRHYRETRGPLSQETRAKIGASSRGKPKSEESKAKNRLAHIGKPVPDCAKRKLSIKNSNILGPFQDENGNVYQSLYDAGKALNISTKHIGRVLAGKGLSVHGHRFKYI
jgi:hypothetical protein